jgi:hypothetical protein
VMRENPGRTIQAGVAVAKRGDDAFFSMRYYGYRSLLVMAGHPYSLDFGTAMEFTKLGIPESPGMIEQMANCTTDIWLIPKDELPFALRGYYGQTVFSKGFQEAFKSRYQPISTKTVYEVWACRKP